MTRSESCYGDKLCITVRRIIQKSSIGERRRYRKGLVHCHIDSTEI